MNIVLLVPILVILAIYYFSLRNGLIKKFNRVEQAYQNLEARIQKRSAAIPSLINLIESHFDKKDKTLLELKASVNLFGSLDGKISRSGGSQKEKLAYLNKQEAILSLLKQKLNKLPKEDQNFEIVLATLNEHEEQLSACRRSFNAAVSEYNIAIESFPSNMIASSMNLGVSNYVYDEEDHLELKDLEEQPSLEKLDRTDRKHNS